MSRPPNTSSNLQVPRSTNPSSNMHPATTSAGTVRNNGLKKSNSRGEIIGKNVTNVFKSFGDTVKNVGNELGNVFQESHDDSTSISSQRSVATPAINTSSSSTPSAPLNVYAPLHEYITHIITTHTGMKSLLLDSETIDIISNIYTQTQLINKGQIMLIENINKFPLTQEDELQQLHHLKAIVLCRPTKTTLTALTRLLLSNRYTEYYVYFMNLVSNSYLELLADGDTITPVGKIKQIHEIYADYYVVNPMMYHMNTTNYTIKHRILSCKEELQLQATTTVLYNRDLQCIQSLLLSLQRKPEIRYTVSSDVCKRLAQEISITYKQHSDLFNQPTFQSHTSSDTLLLVCDRKDDPITPLLINWTYHAMIHELIGIENNIVDMSHTDYEGIKVPNKAGGSGGESHTVNKQIVLTSEIDEFNKRHIYSNFGDLGSAVKKLVNRYQERHKIQAKLDSLEDMQRFMETYSEFKQEESEVTKHMTLFSELNRQVKARHLMDLSAVEQEIVCSSNLTHQEVLDKLMNMINRQDSEYIDNVRLLCLYAIRYESHPQCAWQQVKTILRQQATIPQDRLRVDVVDEILRTAGVKQRLKYDLFHENVSVKSLLQKAKTTVQGIDNIYTQHKPFIHDILLSIANSELKPSLFPVIDTSSNVAASQQHPKEPLSANARPTRYRQVIIYVVGGCTYEEADAVHDIMSKYPHMKCVIGGSTVLRSQMYLDELLPLPEMVKESIVDIPKAMSIGSLM